ncbi:MAG: hypothetical protein K2L55_06290 [Muribaculaceae bacterium]|nr:hypothetical protein [Muribaculaceae bacterium]
MKKLFLILAVSGMFAMTSCSGGYNGEKAHELTQKINSNSFSESDVKSLLGQYEACIKELKEIEEKKGNGTLTDEEHDAQIELLYAMNEIEGALRDRDVEKMCPGTENELFEIYKKYSK